MLYWLPKTYTLLDSGYFGIQTSKKASGLDRAVSFVDAVVPSMDK